MEVLLRQDRNVYPAWSKAGVPSGAREGSHTANRRPEDRVLRLMGLLQWDGVPVSPGITQGTALVDPREDEYGSVPAGSILVCSSMKPSLIELVPSCRGLVCERGGVLNPAATTARECGIPVVSAAGCVAQAVKNGDTLRIDGSTGAVTILPFSA